MFDDKMDINLEVKKTDRKKINNNPKTEKGEKNHNDRVKLR